MLFKKKSTDEKNMGDIMNEIYNEILEIIRQELYGKDNGSNSDLYDYQLVSFIFVLSLYYAKDLKKKKRDKVVQEISDRMDKSFYLYCYDKNGNTSNYFQKQHDFYMQIISGAPIRAEWGIGWPLIGDNDTRMLIALGDRLYNKKCIKDYMGAENRKVTKEDVEGFNIMMSDIRNILLRYYEEFKSIK